MDLLHMGADATLHDQDVQWRITIVETVDVF